MVCPGTALLQNLAVSPGLTLRPSLSVIDRLQVNGKVLHVSPGLTLRPSLSDGTSDAMGERYRCVAGVDAPAFVERPCWCRPPTVLVGVSPGLTLRPSLSGI